METIKRFSKDSIINQILNFINAKDDESKNIYDCYMNNQGYFEFINILNDYMTKYVVAVREPEIALQFLKNIIICTANIFQQAYSDNDELKKLLLKYSVAIALIADDKKISVSGANELIDTIIKRNNLSNPGHGNNSMDSGGEN